MTKKGRPFRRVAWLLAGHVLLLTAAGADAFPVPHSGQDKCYDNSTEIACPPPGQPFYGQDAQYQVNPRSYTKLGANDVVLPDSATQAQGWLATRDNVTGLIWEMKSDDGGLHDKDNTYAWCDSNPATNGGVQGSCANGANTEAFIAAVNAEHFGGFNNWRLPTETELSTLINSSIPYPGPTIDLAWFPNTNTTDALDFSMAFWSSTTNASTPENTWNVYFDDSSVINNGNKISSDIVPGNYVRAVRGGHDGTTAPWVVTGNGTVTDTATCLMWQQATAPGTYNWQEALAYAEGLSLGGHDDWRLPTKNELLSLVNFNAYSPSIDTQSFPGTEPAAYWTSTTYATDTTNAWPVFFEDGNSYYGIPKDSSNYVRAVRGGQCDRTAPSVSSFTLPATSHSLTVTISTLTATDNLAIAQWCLSATDSNAGCAWNNSAPASYTFTSGVSEGVPTTKTLFAWAKDEAGNVSAPLAASTTVLWPQRGDSNGDGLLRLDDAVLILKVMAGIAPTPHLFLSADSDGDGTIHVKDAVFVLQRAAQRE